MSKVNMSAELPVAAAKLWELVGGLGGVTRHSSFLTLKLDSRHTRLRSISSRGWGSR